MSSLASALRCAMPFLLALSLPAICATQADAQTRTDPSDAPAGPSGKTDLRTITWDVGASAATLHVSVDQSTYGANSPAELGLHVLLDTTQDGTADAEVVAVRAADHSSIDWTLRSLTGALSSATCQDLAGATLSQGTVATTIAGGLESFDVVVKTGDVPGGLTAFTWVAFGQSPPDGSALGPWDYVPDTANPDGAPANPGERRCGAGNGGIAARMSAGVVLPDPAPPPPPPPPSPTAPSVPSASLVAHTTGAMAVLDAAGSLPGAGAHVIAYRWDFDGDGHFDTNTGTRATATMLVGARAQTVRVQVIDSRFDHADATIVMHPVDPGPGCETEASIGAMRIRAGCIRHDGQDLVATPAGPASRFDPVYQISLNGLGLVTGDPHAEIRFEMRHHEIQAHGAWTLKVLNTPNGDLEFWRTGTGGFTWPLPTGGGSDAGHVTHIVGLEVSHNCQASPNECATLPGGFPIEGGLDLGIDLSNYEAVVDVNAAVSTPITVSGRVRLRVSLVRGLLLDSIGFGIEDATIGAVQLHHLRFTYEPPGMGDPAHEGDSWNADVDIQVLAVRVAGQLVFIDGRFNYGRADVVFTPGIPIYAGVFMNRFAAEFGIDPLRVGGGLGMSIAAVIQINGDWIYAHYDDGTSRVRIDGDLSIYGNRFAHAYTEYWSNGYFAFGGFVGYRYRNDDPDPGFQISGQMDYWLEDQHNGTSRYQGDGNVTLQLWVLGGSVHGFVNNDWAAGCLDHFYHAAHNFHTNQNEGAPGCDLTAYTFQPTRSRPPLRPGEAARAGAAALPAARAFSVGAGRRALALEVKGTGGAPKVTLVDPAGHVYTPTNVPAKIVHDGAFHSIFLPKGEITLLRVDNPKPGEWRVQPDAGSVPVAGLRSSDALPPLAIHARVVGKGRARTLVWHATGLAGRKLSFAERGRNTGHTITTTTSADGRAAFVLSDGSAGRRTIIAQVTEGGMPMEAPVVASFRAPGPARAARPGRVRLTRSGGDVLVRWTRAPRARGYLLTIRGSDGRRQIQMPGAKTRRARIRFVGPETTMTVTVAGTNGTPSLVGPARRAVLKRRTKR